MKNHIINLALASVASAAFAATDVQNFSWSSQAVSSTLNQATPSITVPGFNSGLGTLTGIAINITGGSVAGSASVVNQGAVTSDLWLSLFGNHIVSINGLTATTSVDVESSHNSTAASGTASLTTASTTLAGSNSTSSTTGWIGGTIPVLLRFQGSIGVNAEPQVTFQATPSITSSGTGTVTYTYTVSGVPEAETYVAGIALAGMVGYGFFRRNRKA